VHLLCWNEWFAAQLTGWELTLPQPGLVALIAHATLIEILAFAAWLAQGAAGRAPAKAASEDDAAQPSSRELVEAWTISGVLSTAVSVPFVLAVPADALSLHAVYAVLIALVWGAAGVMRGSARLMSASYVAATAAIGLVVAACAARTDWPAPVWRDLRHVQWQVIALGLWCGLTTLTCRGCQRWPTARHLVSAISPVLNQILLGALIAVLLALGVVGCHPGVQVEVGLLRPDHPLAQDIWHTHAHALSSWWALASVAVALALMLAQRWSQSGWMAIIALTTAVPLLISGSWEEGRAVASALRWTFAIYASCWACLVVARRQLAARAIPWARARGIDVEPPRAIVRDLAIAVGVLPVLVLTLLGVAQAAMPVPWGGPLPETWFGQLSPVLSYAIPTTILVLALLMLAVRDANSAYAMLGSILCQCTIVASTVLYVAGVAVAWNSGWSITLAQEVAIGLGAYGLIWLGLSHWIERDALPIQHALLQVQVALAAIVAAALSALTAAALLLDPTGSGGDMSHLGHSLGYVAAVLAASGLAWRVRRDAVQLAVLAVTIPVALAPLTAATACILGAAHPWIGYHLLTGVWLVVGWCAVGAAFRVKAVTGERSWSSVLRMASGLLGTAVFVLVVRGWTFDPWHPWWMAGVCGGLFVLWAALAICTRTQWFTYASVVSALVSVWALWSHLAQRQGFDFVAGGVYVTAIAGAAIALFWLLAEVWWQSQRNESFDPRTRPEWRVHVLLAVALTLLLGLFALGGVTFSAAARLGQGWESLTITDALAVDALITLGILLAAMLWDRRSMVTLLLLYGWGLIAIAMGLNVLERTTTLGAELTVMAACLSGAGYIALTGHLWRWGVNLARRATQLQIPDPIARLEYVSRWLPAVNTLGTLLIGSLGFVTIFVASHRSVRMATAFAPAMLAYGIGCLAQRERRLTMQCLSLLILSLTAVYVSWADVEMPVGDVAMLAYAARLLISVGVMTLVYAVVVARWMSPHHGWREAVRRSSLVLAAVTAATFAVVLGLEIQLFEPVTGAPLAAPEVIAISVVLCGFVVGLLSIALLPGRDPLRLTAKGRTAYVYAAQLIAALLFAHVYLAEHELFTGRFREYWPYIVMLLAFGSVGFGELCIRRQWNVIAEPMVRTGGFLPLLPAVAAWAFAETSYPLVLFCAGIVYVFLSITRRSFYAGVAAAVMGNGALWALLAEKGMAIFVQPQLWLIPPALSVLVAAHVNRARLSESSLTALRYICVMIIYLSSAGEMFMKLVVPEAPEEWLRPIILASLSVVGIFAGILVRVRAFLYLGSSFLLLSLVAMVWNAGRLVHHTWPWWVFGITVGLAILVVFGVFEKHRREVQALVARLRQWEA
jgi:hypothetical protein